MATILPFKAFRPSKGKESLVAAPPYDVLNSQEAKALTKDNPYERNRVIAQLQADYLKKRYNKTLGQNDDGSK